MERYQEVFGESVPRPAVFVPAVAAGSTCEWHVTSTAWLRASATHASLRTLYTSADGRTVLRQMTQSPLTPAGTFRVLVALVDHPQSIGPGGVALWEAAQAAINADHEDFAALQGYDEPIVTFENTNVLVAPEAISDAQSYTDVSEALATLGHDVMSYDVVASVDIDPDTTDGGFARLSSNFIYMGNFGFRIFPLDAGAYGAIARAVYGHEFAHLWGWPATHDWVRCHSTTNFSFGFHFWVPPLLLGWEDVDGDGVPEILDATPYGRPGP